MEEFLSAVVELLGELLEGALRGIKNSRKRKWALTIYYSLIALFLSGVFIFLALALYREGNCVGALILSGITGVLILLAGFIIFRKHRKNS